MNKYSKKYKHPSWQKMRLDVFSRDGFKCRHCGTSETTLHAHHRFYISGRDPWDYDPESIITLCEKCHEDAHEHPAYVRDGGFFDIWGVEAGYMMKAERITSGKGSMIYATLLASCNPDESEADQALVLEKIDRAIDLFGAKKLTERLNAMFNDYFEGTGK
jgi:hypothetical protein